MIGKSLRVYRKAAGLTQAALAKELDAGQSTIAQWESGERTPSIKRLGEIATVLGITPAELLEAQASQGEEGAAE